MEECFVTLSLSTDEVERMLPSAEWAIDAGLMTEREAAEMLTEIVAETVKVCPA